MAWYQWKFSIGNDILPVEKFSIGNGILPVEIFHIEINFTSGNFPWKNMGIVSATWFSHYQVFFILFPTIHFNGNNDILLLNEYFATSGNFPWKICHFSQDTDNLGQIGWNHRSLATHFNGNNDNATGNIRQWKLSIGFS